MVGIGLDGWDLFGMIFIGVTKTHLSRPKNDSVPFLVFDVQLIKKLW